MKTTISQHRSGMVYVQSVELDPWFKVVVNVPKWSRCELKDPGKATVAHQKASLDSLPASSEQAS